MIQLKAKLAAAENEGGASSDACDALRRRLEEAEGKVRHMEQVSEWRLSECTEHKVRAQELRFELDDKAKELAALKPVVAVVEEMEEELGDASKELEVSWSLSVQHERHAETLTTQIIELKSQVALLQEQVKTVGSERKDAVTQLAASQADRSGLKRRLIEVENALTKERVTSEANQARAVRLDAVEVAADGLRVELEQTRDELLACAYNKALELLRRCWRVEGSVLRFRSVLRWRLRSVEAKADSLNEAALRNQKSASLAESQAKEKRGFELVKSVFKDLRRGNLGRAVSEWRGQMRQEEAAALKSAMAANQVGLQNAMDEQKRKNGLSIMRGIMQKWMNGATNAAVVAWRFNRAEEIRYQIIE